MLSETGAYRMRSIFTINKVEVSDLSSRRIHDKNISDGCSKDIWATGLFMFPNPSLTLFGGK